MLRPMIQAPIPANPCSAIWLSTPDSPPSWPCMARHARVAKNHSISSSPRTPSGCSRSCRAPAAKPSRETAKVLTKSFDKRLLRMRAGRPCAYSDRRRALASHRRATLVGGGPWRLSPSVRAEVVSHDLATLHHEAHTLELGDVGHRVTDHRREVGELAGFHAADAVLPAKHRCRIDRDGAQHVE